MKQLNIDLDQVMNLIVENSQLDHLMEQLDMVLFITLNPLRHILLTHQVSLLQSLDHLFRLKVFYYLVFVLMIQLYSLNQRLYTELQRKRFQLKTMKFPSEKQKFFKKEQISL